MELFNFWPFWKLYTLMGCVTAANPPSGPF